MSMIKDEKFDDNNMYSGYYDDNNSIYFDDGILEGSAYSYEISSSGTVNLTKEQTKEIYLVMKKYYEK